MNETPQEEAQTLAEYLNLLREIEKDVETIPSIKEEEKEEKIEGKTSEEEITQSKTEQKNSLEGVEERTKSLVQETRKEKEELGETLEVAENICLVKIEKRLKEEFSNSSIQVSDFFFKSKELSEEQIKKKLEKQLPSLTDFVIEERITFGYPFTLTKMKNKFEILLPIEVENIDIPIFLRGSSGTLKLLNCGKTESYNLLQKELELLIQKLNQFQLKVVQLLNISAKENLKKDKPQGLELVDLDEESLIKSIKEFEQNSKKISSYHEEILKYCEKMIKTIDSKEKIWNGEKELESAIQKIKKQLLKMKEDYSKITKETQIKYIKLRRNQKQLNGKTKVYKIEEKRGKVISREEKEELIKKVREFQKKKDQISKEIEKAKQIEKTLEKWVKTIESQEEIEVNKNLLENFGFQIKKQLLEIVEEKELEKIEEKITEIEAILENITIHIIYVPTILYHFTAKQDEQRLKGKMLHFVPTDESFLLKSN
ncbi:MAG: hypothetical protein ACTSUR_05875 [Candidatus Heimdallarchaeaceae archaeon]